MKFLQALRNVSQKLTADFEDSKLFNHRGEKGEFREQIISNLLKPFLPDCYGLGSGEIFSVDGEVSNQIDVVIYDNVYSNVLFKGMNSSLFPCESVYGEIEIKSFLSKDELEASVTNIGSMKKLVREGSSILDLSPINRLRIGQGLNASGGKLNPYLGIIFAYDGMASDSMIEFLNNDLIIREKSLLPDFIFCFKKQYTVIKTRGTEVAPIDSDFDRYFIIETGSDTLPIMFLTLNACLNNIRLKAPDYNKYWMNLMLEVAGSHKGK